ncbi:MAG: hypothetical protein ACE14S_02370 [Candidatus Bathyarchaeia archaeon]
MPERTFFDLRYALPGYTFILFSILIAFPVLQEVLSSSSDNAALFGTFFGFLTLLSGIAIGFLVSQSWHIIFNTFIDGRYGRYPQTLDFLCSHYGLSCNMRNKIFFCDYVHRLSPDEGLKDYIQRRWDLIHLSGATLFSIPLAVVAGLCFRAVLNSGADSTNLATLFITSVLTPARIAITTQQSSLLSNLLWSHVTVLDGAVVLISMLLMLCLAACLWRAAAQHAQAVEVIVLDALDEQLLSKGKAKRIFRNGYFPRDC